MNAKLIPLAIALIGTSGIANAELTTTSGSTGFSGLASATATATSSASTTATNNNAAIATVGVGKFDPTTSGSPRYLLSRLDFRHSGSACASIS
jgi:hypothetical protein